MTRHSPPPWLLALPLLLASLRCGPADVLVGRDGTPASGASAAGQAGQANLAGSSGTSGQAGGSTETLCGSPGAQAPCEAGSFCDHEDKACGRQAAGGTCKPRPALEVCPAACNPICACDGVVYCNECYANNAGTDADPDGSCP
jgi:hypothetical protein